MPSVSSVPRSGNLDIDGILSGYMWTSPVLTFSFPTAVSEYNYTVDGFQAFNAAQESTIRQVLKMYAAASGLSFTEVTETATNHGTIRYGESTDAGTAFGNYPSTDQMGGDAWFNHTDFNAPKKGSYAYLTMIHETGHTIGFDHGQDGRDALPANHDSIEYSVMTYRSYVGSPVGPYTIDEGSYPTTLMMDDIAAAQYMYGANYNTNNGDTTYRWNPSTGEESINGVAQGAPMANKIFMTIWDGGGNDTYDFSNYTTNLTINLTPGSWTTTSTAQLAVLGPGQLAHGNIANAYLFNGYADSLIENAKGGSGNDKITGNDADNVLDGGAGNDTLNGGKGIDTLIGGAGTDTAILPINSQSVDLSLDSLTSLLNLTSLSGGTDVLEGIEKIQFSDETVVLANLDLVDELAPVLVASTPRDGQTGVSPNTNLSFKFSEIVLAGSGSVTIHRDGGTVVESFKAANLLNLSILGTGFTFNPNDDLGSNSHYYVTIDSTAFHDVSGRYYAGISNMTMLDFTTAKASLTGTTTDDTLNGTEGADSLQGFGGNDFLEGHAGNDTLDGGTGADTMEGGDGNDTFRVDSTGDRVEEDASGGTDTIQTAISLTLVANVENLMTTSAAGTAAIKLTGNTLANAITGNAGANAISGSDGNDTLNGNPGNDTISGGNGNDKIYGGLGNDSLTGDAGNDSFVFNTTLGSSNIDRIIDFTRGADRIDLDNAIMAALGTATGALPAAQFVARASDHNAQTTGQHVIYDKADGSLWYDSDGRATTHAAIEFAILTTHPATIAAADFLIV